MVVVVYEGEFQKKVYTLLNPVQFLRRMLGEATVSKADITCENYHQASYYGTGFRSVVIKRELDTGAEQSQ